MTLITTQDALNQACKALENNRNLYVDTEFLRDRTYYARLCLIQLGDDSGNAVAIDTLAEPFLDLTPVWNLLQNSNILKIFHAARQDLEIFYQKMGCLPAPLFDTQVAAMVCGYGDSVGFDTLVHDLTGHRPDKSNQFTDWARRPLSDRQMEYALNDVRFLAQIYGKILDKLEKQGRAHWVYEEMDVLNNPNTYIMEPDHAWERVTFKGAKPKDLIVLKHVAAWRETQAQTRDVPRNRILRDETIIDLAIQKPATVDDLKRVRGMTEDQARGKIGTALIDTVKLALQTPEELWPRLKPKTPLPPKLAATVEMLKMLLRIQAAEEGVAAKLIAHSDDLEALAMKPDAALPLNHGWRYEVFGAIAQKLLQGHIGFTLKNNKIHILDL